MTVRITFSILISWTISSAAFSQADSSKLTIGGYADGYYAWYTNAHAVVLQQHDCIGAYHNNFGLNIAQIHSAYAGDRVRGAITLHAGDIPNITWQDNYRLIQEANGGVRLADRLWLDAGFFKTHVGTESFLPKDNIISIISLGTFYGPFYQSGIRLSYDTKNDWHFELHAINGYNQHIDENDEKSFGVLASKKWSDRLSTTYSNMLGSDRVGRYLRDDYLVYQNIYLNYNRNKLLLQIGADVATAHTSFRFLEGWLLPLVTALATVQYRFNDVWSLAARAEYFSDPKNINSHNYKLSGGVYQITPLAQYDLLVVGGTMSLEYRPHSNGFIRLESRTLHDFNQAHKVYPNGFDDKYIMMLPMLATRTQVLFTIGFSFDKTFKFAR
jgi:hypothetical protein